MASKELVVDFFELILPQGSKPFEQLLQPWMKASLQDRTKAIGGKYVRLADAHFGEKTVEGDFSKIRMDNLPDKASPTRADQPLELSPDEGLSTGRAFYYYAPWQVLLIQRNRNGASNPEIESYLQDAFGLDGLLELRPILQLDAYKRLHDMEKVKTFDIKVGGLTNAALFKGGGHDLGRLVDLLDFFQAPNVHLRISVGRKRNTHLKSSLKALGEKLAKIAGNDSGAVRKVELSGVDILERNQVVDLLLDRLQARVNVVVEGRRLPYEARRSGLSDAFVAKAQDLRKIRASEAAG